MPAVCGPSRRFCVIFSTDMKIFAWLLLLFPITALAQDAAPKFDPVAAERFARLALACVSKEYPNRSAT